MKGEIKRGFLQPLFVTLKPKTNTKLDMKKKKSFCSNSLHRIVKEKREISCNQLGRFNYTQPGL